MVSPKKQRQGRTRDGSGVPALCVIVLACFLAPRSAAEIGWDSNDFLIGGGPNFSNKIGVFDHDLTFKGLLDGNFIGVGGMDFDARGRLVAVSGIVRQVRVYDPSGVVVGGFTRSDTLLGTGSNLSVAPDGSYVVATQNFDGGDGARQFTKDGTFVRQYGSGNIGAASVVPGNHVWIGGQESPILEVYDLNTGAQVSALPVAGMQGIVSMRYSASRNVVLLANSLTSQVFATDVLGNVSVAYTSPTLVRVNGVTGGPDGDVLATTGAGLIGRSVVRWHTDGAFVGSFSTAASIGGSADIVWAGTIPEPAIGLAQLIPPWWLLRRHRKDERL